MDKDRITFKQILLYEKEIAHPLNRIMAYIVTPIYLGVCLVLIVAFAVLMEIDDEKFFIAGICLLGVFAILSVIVLSVLPFIRKRVLQDELNDYDFDFYKVESKSEYCYSTDNAIIKFDKYGMYVNGNLSYYNHLQISIVTDNYCHRILIALRFALDDDSFIQIRLGAEELKMISDLQIPLQNRNILNYILNNKEIAFKQIYNKGHISL